MPPVLLNQVWKLVDTIPHHQLLRASDHALVDLLSQRLAERQELTDDELETVKAYIQSRLTLIRDMALVS
ncbi:hypothetical protein [Acaryochloris marina]|uniref:Uncharacterized protein n=1 Tax=Acaryochloris marina (strain MBIC 11017) TaxID=329726 RepID=B0C4P6_ACAM1|nr:hypothetical protein [Acaryochloris marina]ABW29929.1 conserved hypothetical protein [Acaryochloris marina MBIC11017]BDM78804.1 hypothetical protein AM10699_16730 [Acaryochloris marina MBIC10699]